MLADDHPDRIQIAFDDHRLVANAGLILPATLGRHLGLPELVDRRLDLGRAPGRANTGDKVMTLVASALAGGDCIDDADVLRTGGDGWRHRLRGQGAIHPGDLLRSFRWGHVRQLDRVSRELLARAWAAGAGPGDGPLTIDLDSTICETYGLVKEGARHHSYTGPAGLSPAAGRGRRYRRRAACPGCARAGPLTPLGAPPTSCARRWDGCATAGPGDNSRCGPTAASIPTPWSPSAVRWMSASPSPSASTKACTILSRPYPRRTGRPIPYWMDGAADVAESSYTPFQSEPDAAPVRLIVRRVQPTPGSQLALFATYSYHGCITDREGETLELEADHRRHAEIENAIRDLKYGVGLNHLPSGRFAANGAWLAVQVMAHNLARWTARIGLGEQVVTTKTLRRRFFSLAGRLTRSARRLTLHLPRRWPWENQFSRALARLRALPFPT